MPGGGRRGSADEAELAKKQLAQEIDSSFDRVYGRELLDLDTEKYSNVFSTEDGAIDWLESNTSKTPPATTISLLGVAEGHLRATRLIDGIDKKEIESLDKWHKYSSDKIVQILDKTSPQDEKDKMAIDLATTLTIYDYFAAKAEAKAYEASDKMKPEAISSIEFFAQKRRAVIALASMAVGRAVVLPALDLQPSVFATSVAFLTVGEALEIRDIIRERANIKAATKYGEKEKTPSKRNEKRQILKGRKSNLETSTNHKNINMNRAVALRFEQLNGRVGRFSLDSIIANELEASVGTFASSLEKDPNEAMHNKPSKVQRGLSNILWPTMVPDGSAEDIEKEAHKSKLSRQHLSRVLNVSMLSIVLAAGSSGFGEIVFENERKNEIDTQIDNSNGNSDADIEQKPQTNPSDHCEAAGAESGMTITLENGQKFVC